MSPARVAPMRLCSRRRVFGTLVNQAVSCLCHSYKLPCALLHRPICTSTCSIRSHPSHSRGATIPFSRVCRLVEHSELLFHVFFPCCSRPLFHLLASWNFLALFGITLRLVDPNQDAQGTGPPKIDSSPWVPNTTPGSSSSTCSRPQTANGCQ